MTEKREVGETGVAREQRVAPAGGHGAADPDAQGQDASALGGHSATRSSTRPTPPDEKAGA